MLFQVPQLWLNLSTSLGNHQLIVIPAIRSKNQKPIDRDMDALQENKEETRDGIIANKRGEDQLNSGPEPKRKIGSFQKEPTEDESNLWGAHIAACEGRDGKMGN